MPSSVSLNHRIGIELIQVRTGPSVGKPTYRGIQHHGGTRGAIQRELWDTFARMRSGGASAQTEETVTSQAQGEEDDDDGGRAIRIRLEAMQQKYYESWKTGRARKAMWRFAHWM